MTLTLSAAPVLLAARVSFVEVNSGSASRSLEHAPTGGLDQTANTRLAEAVLLLPKMP